MPADLTPQDYTQIWMQRVWNNGEEQAIRELMSPDCRMGGLPIPPGSPAPIESFISLHRSFCNAFSGIKMEILNVLSEGDTVIGQALFTALHQRSGRAVTIPYSFWGRWVEGKLVAARNILDYSPMLLELGIVTPVQLQSIFKSPEDSVSADDAAPPAHQEIPFIAEPIRRLDFNVQDNPE